MSNIDWGKPVTFDAAHENFEVKAVKDGEHYRISSTHFRFCVDRNGKPFNDFYKNNGFDIRNEET